MQKIWLQKSPRKFRNCRLISSSSHWTHLRFFFFCAMSNAHFRCTFNFQFSPARENCRLSPWTGMKLTLNSRNLVDIVFLLETESRPAMDRKKARHDFELSINEEVYKRRWIFFLQSFWVRNDDVARHTELWHKITIIRMLQVIAFSLHLFFLPFIPWSWAHKTFSAMLLIARPHLACASVADHLFADLAQWHQSSNGQTHLISWLYRKMNGFDFSFCYVSNELQLVKFVVCKQINPCHNLTWIRQSSSSSRTSCRIMK